MPFSAHIRTYPHQNSTSEQAAGNAPHRLRTARRTGVPCFSRDPVRLVRKPGRLCGCGGFLWAGASSPLPNRTAPNRSEVRR